MRKTLFSGAFVAGLLVVLQTAVSAGPLPTMTLYTVDPGWVAGADSDRAADNNAVGGEFRTPAETRLVTHVGFIDKSGGGLVKAHRIRVWQISGSTYTLKVDQVILPGQGELMNCFRWVELATPVTLAASSKFAISATTNAYGGGAGDMWKDCQMPSPGNPDGGGFNTYDWRTGYAEPYNGTTYTPWAKYLSGGYNADPTTTGQNPPKTSPGGWAWDRIYVAGNIGMYVYTPPRPPGAVIWTGGTSNNIWDLFALNWTLDGSATVFVPGDAVTFDDTGSDSPAVNLSGAVQPASLVVDTSVKHYTFAGVGPITGSTGLVKRGAGTLTLQIMNDYTGATDVQGGTLELATPNLQSGAIAGGRVVTVQNGATILVSGDNGLSGWGDTFPAVTLLGGSTMTTADNKTAHLANLTLSGGTLASGIPNSTYGSWNILGTITVSGGTSTSVISATNVWPQTSGGAYFNVSSVVPGGIDLDVTGTLNGDTAHNGQGLIKGGAGRMQLSAANAYLGPTFLWTGTLKLGPSGAITASPLIALSPGTFFDVSDVPAWSLGASQTLSGSGTVTGSVGTVSGSTIAPRNTLTVTNGVTLNTGAILALDVGTVGDMLRITGGAFATGGAGSVQVKLANGGAVVGQTYNLIDWTGADASGVAAGDFVPATGSCLTGTFSIVGSSLQFTVAGVTDGGRFVEKFNYDLGGQTSQPITNVTSDWKPVWGNTANDLFQQDPGDATNTVLTLVGNGSSGPDHGVYRNLGCSNIPPGGTATLFLQFLPSGSTAHSIGLTDLEQPAGWGDFRFMVNTHYGYISAQTYNGETRLANLTGGQRSALPFYNLWVVIDHQANTYKLYMHDRAGEDALETDRLAGTDGTNVFPFNSPGTRTLDTFIIYVGATTQRQWYDNIHLLPGETLRNPAKPYSRFDLDFNNTVDSHDYDIFVACSTGPGIAGPPAGCASDTFALCDANGDGAVDIDDFGAFQVCYSGTAQADPACGW